MKVPWRIFDTLAGIYLSFALVDAHSFSRDPLNYLSIVENATIQTPSHRVHSYSTFDLHFGLRSNNQRLRLTLEPNQDIIADGASVKYLSPEGELVRSEPIDRHAHRIFKGDAWIQESNGHWSSVGWARVMIKSDGISPLFEGVFTIGRDHHHVQLRSHYMATRHELDPIAEDVGLEYMVIFRDSDVGRKVQSEHLELKRSALADRSCHSEKLHFNADPSQTVLKRDTGTWGATSFNSLFGKRQIDTNGIPTGGNSGGVNLKNSIGKKDGCPSTRKVALIGVATDCSYTGTFNSTESAHANVIQQISSASSLYERSFNISLGLQNLTVSNTTCPGTPPAATPWNQGCGGNQTITDRLNTFSTWRGQQKDNNAYWMLLTNCRTGSEVGLSWLGQLCVSDVAQNSGETVSGACVVAKTSTEWQVMAHESGHTFGAVHDCDSQPLLDRASQQSPAINAAMGLSRRTRIVTAAAMKAVETMLAAILRVANLRAVRSATTPMKTAVKVVNLRLTVPSVELAPANAILKRFAAEVPPHVLLTRMLPTGRVVAKALTIYSALVDNAHQGISSARH
ncbi:uncharacterized protein KY384_004444 [Bacidia gigantensis]|uniref:uncharacterized protein n=1 Tax=Bacidia gigantensis TaxID=2732470 RepID=UPI001D03604A|nr:uncharacterized protein KY384_004444 [Bacidia gigantensis]KAG8531087.1 hypothetical protein KY384_004444 [Bacidia gigantensis]